MNEEKQPWYLSSFMRWRIFRGVPMSRLWVLLTAAFLLFSVSGFYTDLMSHGTIPYAIVLMIAAVAGLDAVLWIITFARFPSWVLIPVIVLQFFIGTITAGTDAWMRSHLHLSPVLSETGIRFAATSMFWVTILAYVCFFRYILREGRQSLRLQNELDLAHAIQRTLVPPLELRTPHFEIYGISQPSERVGGDLVDAVTLPQGEIVAYLADIAGHGLTASILMGRVKTAARTALLDAGGCSPRETLPLLLDRLNVVLPQVKEPQMYATLTAFRFGADGTIFYALAASPPILQWHAAARTVSDRQEPQFPLGLLPVSSFDTHALDVAPGDLLVVATDGILEVANKRGEEFSIDRLKSLIAENSDLPLAELARKILSAARAFGLQFDDQTMLLVRCH